MKIMKKSISAKNQKKLTFLKLIIVLVIIGILPALALSDSKKTDIKNKQSEAKMILKQIYTMQKAYKTEKGVYLLSASVACAANPNAFATIRIEIPSSARYSYTLTGTDAGATNFTATAWCGILDEDPKVDVWVINQTGLLFVTVDDATK